MNPQSQGQVEAKAIRARVVVSREVEIAISDPDVIERVTGPNGDEWRAQLYDLRTRDDVLEHARLPSPPCGRNSPLEPVGRATG